MYIKTGTKQSIKQIENSGKTITLSDNSKWEISFLDKSKTMFWSKFDEVIINTKGLRFEIKNVKKNELAEAKLI